MHPFSFACKAATRVAHRIPIMAFVVASVSSIVCSQRPIYAQTISPESRNYGFFMIRVERNLADMPSTNAAWVRMAGVASWGLVEETPGSGIYDFTKPDSVILEAKDLGISLLLTVTQVNSMDPGASRKSLPTNMAAYKAFLTAFVERYDGDSYNDAPTSPVVKYWQIGNEPDNETATGEKIEWNDTPENYALFLKESADAIRSADPTATVLIGGLARGSTGLQEFYEPVFTAIDGFGGGPYFDIFDIHWFGTALTDDYYGMDGVVAAAEDALTAHGYGDLPIWVTETATYSDTPEGLETQTEELQARDLARRLIHYRRLDAQKVFWAPLKEFHEWKGIPNGYFDNTGLINNPLNDGTSSNKKAYYTFQFLADKLDGGIVQFGADFMGYMETTVFQGCEFTNNGNHYYSLWIDDPNLVPMPISYPTSYEVLRVYHLVPDSDNKILREVVHPVNGNFEYSVGLDPILIEYASCTDADKDGYCITEGDCNDANPSVNPSQPEICNGLDDDCDTLTDEGQDLLCDNSLFCDGAETCAGVSGCQTGASPCDDGIGCTLDTCDEVNDTCANTADDLACVDGQWCNGDEYCDPLLDCVPGTSQNCDDQVDCTNDVCDEVSDACTHTPDGPEICDGIDNDCDNLVDCEDPDMACTIYYQDGDTDGYGNSSITITACSQPAGYVSDNQDCDDGNRLINPGALEICNEIDDDCDTAVDETGCGPFVLMAASIGSLDGTIIEYHEDANYGGAADAISSGPTALKLGDDWDSVFTGERQLKAVVSFDTSAIPDTATILSAVLKLTKGGKVGKISSTSHGPCYGDIKMGYFGPSQALEKSDFEAVATVVNAVTMPWPSNGSLVSTGTISSAGLAAINKQGLTQIRLHFKKDDNNNNSDDYVGCYSGDTSTIEYRPVLEVTYRP